MQRESRTVMRNPAPDTRENVARTTGVQDHEAGFFEKLIFWRTKRRYGHVLLSTRIRAKPATIGCSCRLNDMAKWKRACSMRI